MHYEWVTTTRDCAALSVPDGGAITIPEGAPVMITQQLGDSFTVNFNGNFARIEGADADALGKEPVIFEFGDVDPSAPVYEEHVREVLKTCYDPEIPVNIVDLGLIYACDIDDHDIHIKMTLTAPGCGMGDVIAKEVERKLLKLPNAKNVSVEIVFDPPWNRDMLTETAKVELGLI